MDGVKGRRHESFFNMQVKLKYRETFAIYLSILNTKFLLYIFAIFAIFADDMTWTQQK